VDNANEPILKKNTSLRSLHLDAFRGIAALIVVVGHERGMFFTTLTSSGAAENAGASLGTYVAHDDITIGNEAVMVFFVLSGFLVGGSVLKLIREDRWSWSTYLIKRLTRLWVVLIPALLLGFMLDVGGSYLFSGTASIYSAPLGQPYVSTPDLSTLYRPGIILGNITFLQGIFVPTAGTNVALWSLTNEFWYYILFPMLVLALKFNQATWKRILYFGVSIVILFGAGSHISFLFLIWLLGPIVSLLPLAVPSRIAVWGSGLFTIMLVISFVEVRTHVSNIYAGEAVIGLIFAILIYLIFHEEAMSKGKVYAFLATFMSKMSYTLYLVHLPILVFLCALVNTPWRLWPKTSLNASISLTLLGVTVALAYLFYCMFEANTDRCRKYVSLIFRRWAGGLHSRRIEAWPE
jgi:peptidoglycan/LPS O-acetylase OafA/YrhL